MGNKCSMKYTLVWKVNSVNTWYGCNLLSPITYHLLQHANVALALSWWEIGKGSNYPVLTMGTTLGGVTSFFLSLIINASSTYICNNVVFIHILHVLLHLYTYQWYLNRFIENKHLLSDFKMWSQYRNNSRSGSTKTSLGRYKKHLWTYRLTRTVIVNACRVCWRSAFNIYLQSRHAWKLLIH